MYIRCKSTFYQFNHLIMKKKLHNVIFGFVLFISSNALAQVSPYELCDDNNDGIELFDLTTKVSEILNGDNPDDYTVTFYETYDDSQSGTNAIANPEAYTNIGPQSQHIYTRKASNNGIDTETNYFILYTLSAPITGQPLDLFSASGVFNLTENSASILAGSNYDITFYTSQSDAESNTNAIANSTAFASVTAIQTIWGRVTNPGSGCFAVRPFKIFTGADTIVNIPDANFKAKLFQVNTVKNASETSIVLDTNGDGEVQLSEAFRAVRVQLYNSNISDLTGIGAFINLRRLYCSSNDLTLLDLSENSHLELFWADGNENLTHINVQNGTNLNPAVTDPGSWMEIWGNLPDNLYICADASEVDLIAPYINVWGHTGQTITTYCNFEPEENQNIISGNARFDAGNDGCDDADNTANFIRLTINDGQNSGYTFTHGGIYQFYTSAGTFELTPDFENNYFTFSPNVATVTTTAAGGEIIQDFCIAPNGNHPDVTVLIVPLQAAVPGFGTKYKIVYSNNGNQAASGSVTFNYNESLLDFTNASITADAVNSGTLTWNYNNFMPFETREIVVYFQVNAPTDTPPANSGDMLSYTAAITNSLTDETPEDNSFIYDTMVVNSYDPNNILCLEGETAPTNAIGDYLHYVVNFENTGNYIAANIVVKLEINADDYDVNSLYLLNSSAAVTARITGNIAEFIFEGINLEAGAHGNFSFKLKTNSTLTEGDEVVSQAGIYFDFNLPVLTNNAQTSFVTLGTSSSAKNDILKIFPNPAKAIVNLQASTGNISKIELCDIQGRKLDEVFPDAASATLNLADRQAGIYIIKVMAGDAVIVKKIIKE